MKALLARFNIDPYILLLLGTVALASLLPARGIWADIVGIASKIGIVLLFFLHGARLSREAVVAGAQHWRLHLCVAAMTYGLFPVLGVLSQFIPGVDPTLGRGLLFLTLLPSTVQSSIAFTAIAHGNVAAAVCSASFSNLAGIGITPLLTATLMHSSADGGFSSDAVLTIVVQLLLPFLAGHLLRPWIGDWVAARKAMLTYVDRGSILLVVYSAFGAAVVAGLWDQVTLKDFLIVLAVAAAMLAIVLWASQALGRWMGFAREDIIVLQFCGSKKSLASGVPMAGVLFPAAQVGAIILPLMLFHQLQLMVCAVLARRYGRQAELEAAA
ncbi:bile acid:sodium symporter [Sandaracinobacter neustonicus]|uniref:Bile acid:sodium symporter n=1 Tax=Sandaracinobacter neustonicus TaxID=1715348 RepID=A0A501XNH4_9SPHN|nr:bile acid:sodium symporter family protein [Sandaracinobacter neustonicus]TPE62198.1 bile acid:sodium symporter [Sandaracinobacter neustonicus]